MTITIAVTALWAAVLFQGVLLILLYRQVGLTYLARGEAIARDGPPLGARISAGLSTSVSRLAEAQQPWSSLILIFARQNCHVCRALWPDLKRFIESASNTDVRVVLVFSGAREAAVTYRKEHGLERCGIIEDQTERLFRSSRVRISPFAIVVDPTFKVRHKGLVNHQDHLKQMTSWRAVIKTAPVEDQAIDRRADAIELAG